MSKSLKLYPKMGKDEGGLKFYFDHELKHFTIRLSGNPIMLLEYMYNRLGGENFMANYLAAKAGNKISKMEAMLLSKSSKRVNEFLEVMQDIGEANKSPFVVYVSDFNNFKS